MFQVRLLGEVALEYDHAPVALDSARLQSLIGLLVLRRDAPQDRARVAFELWPDSTESQARTNLRHLIHDLRGVLPGIDEVVHTTNRTLQWRPRMPVRVDVEVFETALDEAATAGDEDSVRSALEAAVGAYGGDLLPNSWDDWVLTARDRLRTRAIGALEALAALLDSRFQGHAGREHWDRLVRLDPVNETGYRGLMRSHAASGDRGRALRVYHSCVSVLERELGLPPSRETTEVYESLVRGDVASPRAEAAVAPTGTLVGRELEWTQVMGAWRRAVASGPHVLIVAGEPGIGKTRIVEELARSCEAEGGAVARARAYAAGGRLPFHPVSDWLRSDPVAPHVARLERVWRSEVARLVPELGDEEPGREEYLADPGLRRHLLEAIGRAFSIGRPLLLVLDDVQWADPDTMDVVHHLAQQSGEHALLIAVTVRDGEMTPGHPAVPVVRELRRDGLLTEVLLERLGREKTVELVGRLLGEEAAPERVERLWRETEGNPLFVIEAVRAGFPGVGGALTKTVQSMFLSRLTSVSEPAQRITELAATSGRAFTVEVLIAATGGDEEAVLDALDELWHRRIVREQGAGYDFTHDKLREVAYLAVSPVRRRRLHRAIADALQAVQADDPSVSTELAQHRERGGQFLEAIAAHRAAAQHALTMFATDDAIASLGQALTLLEEVAPSARRDELEVTLRLELGAQMVSRRGYGDAMPFREMFDRALTLSRRLKLPPDPALLRGLAIGAVASCQLARCRQLGEELALAAAREPIALVEGHYVLGVAAFWLGELATSSRHLEQAIASHREECTAVHLTRFSQDPLGVCLVRRALTEWYRGSHDDAWSHWTAALARIDELAHPYTSEYVLCYAAWLALEAGEVEELRRIVDRGRTAWHQEGFFGPALPVLEGWLANVDGRPDGLRLLEEGLSGWSRPDRNLHRSWVLSLLARAHLLRGAVSDAESAVAAGLEWSAAHDQHYIEADLLRVEGEVCAARGNMSGAADRMRRARELAHAQGALWLEHKAAVSLSRSDGRNA